MDDLAFYFVEERSEERYCGVNCRIYYHRIFERKWRMGEGFRISSPCMPYLSVEQQKPTHINTTLCVVFFVRGSKTNKRV